MNDKIIDIDALEEMTLIKSYIKHLATENPAIKLLECPITSIKEGDMSKGQCIPDAILNDRSWLELTTISRSRGMRQQIGDMRKHPEKFEGQRFIPGIQKFNPIDLEFYDAVIRKINKDYSQFTELAKTNALGRLLIMLVNNDPFFDLNAYAEFLDTVWDKRFWVQANFLGSCFEQIVFGAMVLTTNGMQLKFETILQPEAIQRIKSRNERKERMLNAFKGKINHI